MSEYIKRDSVTNLIKLMEYPNGVIECYADEFISDINAIPSADVAPLKRGEWIIDDPIQVITHCSNCKWTNVYYAWNYCPNCGADMRKDGT